MTGSLFPEGVTTSASQPGSASADVRMARAGLLRCAEPQSPGLAAWVAGVGPMSAWEAVCSGRVPRPLVKTVGARTVGLDGPGLQRRALEDLAWAAELGARLVVPEDVEWPTATMAGFELAEELIAPLGLYVRGRPLPASQYGSVTVIGSRDATGYGKRIAADLGYCLASAGRTVVSGAAFGIDVAAHRAALAAGPAGAAESPTVAVLSCGLDRPYPKEHADVLEQIAAAGSVVSEYPPGTTPARHRFLVRNRLIAALGEATVVVEAGPRSGSTATVHAAQRLNRLVMAVPGPVTSLLSRGCHQLIAHDGAVLVTGADDVLALLSGATTGAPAPDPSMPVLPTDGLDPDVARVYDALPGRGFRSLDRIAVDAGLATVDALDALAELDLRRLARRDGTYWRRVLR